MKVQAVFFPFDLFGAGGTAGGAEALADALREVLADNRRETARTRASCYTSRVRIEEVTFETVDDYAGWRERGRGLARAALAAGDFLLWVGGNHLAALPVYDELSALPDALVVQLDAHLDVQNFRDSPEGLSHGNFLMHCAGPLPPVVNVGHRDLLLPAAHVAKYFREAVPAHRLAADPAGALGGVVGAVRALPATGRVFLDLDCDVFDPSVFPAVARPVPFGLAPWQVLAAVEAVGPARLAGLMVSEYDPGRDPGEACLATLVWLLEYVLLRRFEGNERTRR